MVRLLDQRLKFANPATEASTSPQSLVQIRWGPSISLLRTTLPLMLGPQGSLATKEGEPNDGMDGCTKGGRCEEQSDAQCLEP